MIEDIIIAKGNEDIVAMDPQKIIITKSNVAFDDSVIGTNADKSANDLSNEIKEALKSRKKIHVVIRAGDVEDEIIAFGSFDIKASDKQNIVLTKTDFIDSATIGVKSNKSARQLSRELVKQLRIPDNLIEIYLRIKE
ncbi:MAG: DUF371 domain-containing protein [Candidatus Aenigmatarchaeota archaeon]